MRWVRALALIATGLALMVAGGVQVRPTSSEPSKPQRIVKLNHRDSQVAELHQRLGWYDPCEELARTDPTVWDRWPCVEVRPQAG